MAPSRSARRGSPNLISGIPNYHGLQVTSRDQLYENSRKAHAAGWQLATHANGDLAIDMVLGVYEQVQREMPKPDPRFRTRALHAAQRFPAAAHARSESDPGAVLGYVYFHGDVMHFYGEARTRTCSLCATSFLWAASARLLRLHRQPFRPMMWLRSQVTRTDMHGNVWGAESENFAGRSNSLRHHQRRPRDLRRKDQRVHGTRETCGPDRPRRGSIQDGTAEP